MKRIGKFDQEKNRNLNIKTNSGMLCEENTDKNKRSATRIKKSLCENNLKLTLM